MRAQIKPLFGSPDHVSAQILLESGVYEASNAHQDKLFEIPILENGSGDPVGIHDLDQKEDCAKEIDSQGFGAT